MDLDISDMTKEAITMVCDTVVALGSSPVATPKTKAAALIAGAWNKHAERKASRLLSQAPTDETGSDNDEEPISTKS